MNDRDTRWCDQSARVQAFGVENAVHLTASITAKTPFGNLDSLRLKLEITISKVIPVLAISCLLIAVLAFAGCASIPPESVALSRGIGDGMQNQHQAHVALVNLFFDEKKQALDQWIEGVYTPEFIKNFREALKAKGENPDVFTGSMASEIVKRIVKARDQREAELDKVRTAIIERLNSNYGTLVKANAELTALLESAAKVNESTDSLLAAVKEGTGGKIDLEEIGKKFDEQLLKAGNAADTTTGFYESVRGLIGK